ncbi:MAG: GspH/FimT family pseudopilin [Pseudomonadota bacterium]
MEYPQCRLKAGFTLIECMVVLLIVGIVGVYAVPAFAKLMSGRQIANAADSLHRTIKLARSEAVIRGRPIRICASIDGARCSGNRDLGVGWIAYVDLSPQRFRHQMDPIVTVQSPMKHLSILYNRATEILINAHGRIGLNGSVNICDNRKLHPPMRLVVVHSTRIRKSERGTSCPAV